MRGYRECDMAENYNGLLQNSRKFGEYDVNKPLAKGGMGEVYLLRSPADGEFCASNIKLPCLSISKVYCGTVPAASSVPYMLLRPSRFPRTTGSSCPTTVIGGDSFDRLQIKPQGVTTNVR